VLEAYPENGRRGHHHGQGRAGRSEQDRPWLSVFVSVQSGDHSDAWLRKFGEAVSSMPEGLELYRMAGDVD